MAECERRDYMEFLLRNRDREMVKVLTGMRGAGKTTLLAQYIHHLRQSGVPENRILYLDLSEPEMQRHFPQETLYRYILSRLPGGQPAYIFLDEVQELPDFARLADGLFRIRHFDLCLAGSAMDRSLSSLTSLLPGRCRIRTVYPLSFSETAAGRETPPQDRDLLRYAEGSSLPGLFHKEALHSALDTILSAALFHELCDDASLRTGLLLKILRYLAEHAGEPVAMQAMETATGRAGRPLLEKTLRSYLRCLEEAGLLLTVPSVTISDGTLPEPDGRTIRFFFSDGAMAGLWSRRGRTEWQCLCNATAVELFRRYGAVETAASEVGPVDFLTGRREIPVLWQLIPHGDDRDAPQKWQALLAAPATCRKIVLTFTPEAFPGAPSVFVRPLLPWFLRGRPASL